MPSPRNWSARDVVSADSKARAYRKLAVTRDLELVHRPSRVSGKVVAFTADQRVVLCDIDGNLHEFRPHPGVMLHHGKPVELIPGDWSTDGPLQLTASGSVAIKQQRSRSARASRIWVEGIHDAELIEKIWGDDLRHEGIVVEPMHGVDDLESAVRSFQPGARRRLGILLDHLVAGSKESRAADAVAQGHVLVCGHPYVDIWEAVKPAVLGITAWPKIPRETPWKEGVIAAFGRTDDPGSFWRAVLERVNDYRDVETPLVNAVEQLIDFVTVHE